MFGSIYGFVNTQSVNPMFWEHNGLTLSYSF